uniref:Potassium channel domain-containing protein n=1 Tax=Plectus sambesii TaxID=2011161 RepID=A0A914XLJ1_9BILA
MNDQSVSAASKSILRSKLKESISKSAPRLKTTIIDTTQLSFAEEAQEQSDHSKVRQEGAKYKARSAEVLRPNDSHASSYKSARSVHSTAQTMQKIGVELVKIEHKLKRQSWCPLLYLIVLPAYTFLGGFIFQAVEGANDDRLIKEFERRCIDERDNAAINLRSFMIGQSVNATVAEMFTVANATIMAVDQCIRRSQPLAVISMSYLSNAMRYAVTIYTTLGYGNMAAKTVGGRVLTMLYAMAGIPIFLAFTADWGLVLSNLLNWISAFAANRIRCREKSMEQVVEYADEQLEIDRRLRMKQWQNSPTALSVVSGAVDMQVLADESPPDSSGPLRELRRFGIIMLLFILYFLIVSAVVQALEFGDKWSYIDALHFVFASVALIGFGDLYPTDNIVFLCVELPLICLGTILIAMAYYFMQEEIRTIPVRAQRSFKYISSVRTARHKTADAASQHSVEITDGDVVAPLSPTTAVEMSAYRSSSTWAS